MMSSPSSAYQERRVRVADYGRIPFDSPLLVPVPSVPGRRCRAHVCVVADLERMIADCEAATGERLLVTSGVRVHRWKDRADYEQYLVANYTDRGKDAQGRALPPRTREEAIKEGQRWIAYDSPHETGLAVDFGSAGLSPKRHTAAKQRQTAAWTWLRDNAWRYGWHPYKPEPWHWEHPISLAAWQTGTPDPTARAA